MPKNNSEAGLSFARFEGTPWMATSTPCDKHLFEEATGMCRACRRPFCPECLVYAQGPSKPPFCIPCALTAAGVRSTAASQARRGRRGMAGRLLGGMAATIATAMVAIPALTALH
jgi:hypothetical protein